MNNRLLSEEMRATADAIHSVRTRLIQLAAEGKLPEWAWPDASTIQVDGLRVADAMLRLAGVPRQRTPTHLDERR